VQGVKHVFAVFEREGFVRCVDLDEGSIRPVAVVLNITAVLGVMLRRIRVCDIALLPFLGLLVHEHVAARNSVDSFRLPVCDLDIVTFVGGGREP
jgi:hypothetical protein